MRMFGSFMTAAVALLCAACATDGAAQVSPPTASTTVERTVLKDVYRADPFKPPVVMHSLAEELGTRWDFDDGSLGGFTEITGVENLRVEDGKLVFVLFEKETTLTWKNAGGKSLWPGRNIVRLRLKQAIPESKWTLSLTNSNDDAGEKEEEATAEADAPHRMLIEPTRQGWHDMDFDVSHDAADGFTITIRGGHAGNKIELDSLDFLRPEVAGFFRRTFSIPAGAKVWRATGSFASGTTLYVNGAKLDSGLLDIQDNGRVISLDIAPHLKSGENCIAMTAALGKTSSAFIYFQGQAVLDSGEVIVLDGV